jgi:three-Cys-motif partner protein
MAKKPQEFQKERFEWSKWKHAILESYLKQMTAVLRKYRTIYIVDGFAGSGRYVEDGADGSALLVAKHAAQLAVDNQAYSLKCINVEKDEEVFGNLQNATAPYAQYVTNFQGDFADFIPQILDAIGDQPTLFFLDPIGFKGLEWNKLLPIFKRKAITELLIRYDAQSALRGTGFRTSDYEHAPSHGRWLLDIFGVKNTAYWENYIDNAPSSRDGITTAYEDRLRKHFDYVARIPIRRQDDFLKYYLIFATRNPKGIQVMNDNLYVVEGIRDKVIDLERRQPDTAKQLSFFDETLYQLNELKQLILEVLEVGQKIQRYELRARVALTENALGKFSGAHYTAVLGGKPRKFEIPKEFVSLKDQIQLESKPGNDKTRIRRVR